MAATLDAELLSYLGISNTPEVDYVLQSLHGLNMDCSSIQAGQVTSNDVFVRENQSSSFKNQELKLPGPYFEILESGKEKAQPYFISEDTIMCKKNERINIVLKNGILGQAVHMLMQYADTNYSKKPVHPCGECEKKHQEMFSCTDHSGSNFCLKVEGNCGVQYLYGEEVSALVDVPGSVDLLLQPSFLCLNSCQPHKDCGKKLMLVCCVINNRTKDLINEQHFQIRCCAAPKRDIDSIKKQKAGNSKRLKATSEAELPATQVKQEKMREIEGCSQLEEDPYESITVVPGEPQWIAFQMPDIKKQMTVLNVIEQIGGGKVVPVEFQIRYKEQE